MLLLGVVFSVFVFLRFSLTIFGLLGIRFYFSDLKQIQVLLGVSSWSF